MLIANDRRVSKLLEPSRQLEMRGARFRVRRLHGSLAFLLRPALQIRA